MAAVDVRRDDEWRDDHIPYALHLHLGELSLHLDQVPRNTPVAVVCRSDRRAEIAARMIATTGRQVIDVQGGVPDWIAQGLPSTTDETAVPVSSHEHTTHTHP